MITLLHYEVTLSKEDGIVLSQHNSSLEEKNVLAERRVSGAQEREEGKRGESRFSERAAVEQRRPVAPCAVVVVPRHEPDQRPADGAASALPPELLEREPPGGRRHRRFRGLPWLGRRRRGAAERADDDGGGDRASERDDGRFLPHAG